MACEKAIETYSRMGNNEKDQAVVAAYKRVLGYLTKDSEQPLQANPHVFSMNENGKMDEAEIQKGKFTAWCKSNGFDGPSIACSKKAMASNSTSAHKMATFYMNTVQPKGKTTKDI